MSEATVRILLGLLFCVLGIASSALAGPVEERLAELEAKGTLTTAEVDEVIRLAYRGNHSAADVGCRDRAISLLAKQTLTAAQGDALSDRLRVRGGETEDFVRVRIPAIVAASGTKNFATHVRLARQVAEGGPPQLLLGTLVALETLKPVDETVSEILARTALNPNQRLEVRRRALALAGAIPAEPGHQRDFVEGALIQAARDPELRETAVAALRGRKLSEETSAQIARAASVAEDAGWAQEVLAKRPELTHFRSATQGSGRFSDRDSCFEYLSGEMYRRVQTVSAGARGGPRRTNGEGDR